MYVRKKGKHQLQQQKAQLQKLGQVDDVRVSISMLSHNYSSAKQPASDLASHYLLPTLLHSSRKLQSTGVSVKATIVDANKLRINAIPRGTSIRPSIPLRKNNGRKHTTMMSVELRIGIRTSREALNTTSINSLSRVSSVQQKPLVGFAYKHSPHRQ